MVESGLQGLFDRGGNFIYYDPEDYLKSESKSIRYRTSGIVALTSSNRLIAPNVYDISLGGLSFLHANEKEVTNSLFKMDILIFDIQTDFEYLITGVKGRINSKELFFEPFSRMPIWRFHVDFLDLDGLQENLLQSFCDLVQGHSKHSTYQ